MKYSLILIIILLLSLSSKSQSQISANDTIIINTNKITDEQEILIEDEIDSINVSKNIQKTKIKDTTDRFMFLMGIGIASRSNLSDFCSLKLDFDLFYRISKRIFFNVLFSMNTFNRNFSNESYILDIKDTYYSYNIGFYYNLYSYNHLLGFDLGFQNNKNKVNSIDKLNNQVNNYSHWRNYFCYSFSYTFNIKISSLVLGIKPSYNLFGIDIFGSRSPADFYSFCINVGYTL